MSALSDRNIWIPSRVPQTLPCSNCGRTASYLALHEPEQYEYACASCGSTRLLTLTQINMLESNRFHKMPVAAPPIITRKPTHSAK